MKKYELYSEWRNKVIYGENIKDAIKRCKEIQKFDKFENGAKIEDGEIVEIKRVVMEVDTAGNTRGTDKYKSVLIESVDGKILSVDAKETEIVEKI